MYKVFVYNNVLYNQIQFNITFKSSKHYILFKCVILYL